MKRHAYLILFVIVLGLPFLLRLAVTGGEGVREEGEILRVITPHNQDIRREFARVFAEWHWRKHGTAARVEFLNVGGTNDIKRQLEITYSHYRDAETKKLEPEIPDRQLPAHVVWGGGDFFFDVEIKGILQPMRLEEGLIEQAFPQQQLAGVRLLDPARDQAGRPNPRWVGVCLSAFGIVYNSDLYDRLRVESPELEVPKGWEDLARPELAGLVALADPSHSGSAAVAYMMVIQRNMADAEEEFFKSNEEVAKLPAAERVRNAEYQKAIAAGWKKGMGELVLIAANARYFTDSASQVPHDVGNGQAAAGMAIDFYGRVYQESVGPRRCTVVMPRAATAITPDPVGILHGVSGEKLQLATRFVEFLLSPEGQRLWILKAGQEGGPRLRGLRRPPVRRDLYADRAGWSDDVNPFEEAGGFNQRREWMVLFGDTRPVWGAAWIDSRPSLKSAYEMVLRVKSEKARTAFLKDLARLPVEMSDIQKDQQEREAQKEDLEEWKARRRIAWAAVFRKHYAAVQARAHKVVIKEQKGVKSTPKDQRKAAPQGKVE